MHLRTQNGPEALPAEPDRAAFRTMASAIAENRIVLAYQPVMSARRQDMPAFFECLARIVGRDGIETSAGPLIEAVEATDLGRLVDRAVLRQALATLAAHPGRRLSVNLSACGIGDRDWLALIADADERSPGIGDWLIVEITETASLTLDAAALDFLFELRRLGVSLALDDFGSGHTSLKQLGKFRFDFLKIDGSLCTSLKDDRQRLTMLRSILRVARHFDLVTVAECVETGEDAAILIAEGVDCLQGYHFGLPDTAPEWLDMRRLREA